MSRVADHLMVAPVVLPLVAGAAMLLLDGERRRKIKAAIDVASTFALVAIAVALLGMSGAAPAGSAGGCSWPVTGVAQAPAVCAARRCTR